MVAVSGTANRPPVPHIEVNHFYFNLICPLLKVWRLFIKHKAIVELLEPKPVALNPHEACIQRQDQYCKHKEVVRKLEAKLHKKQRAEKCKEC